MNLTKVFCKLLQVLKYMSILVTCLIFDKGVSNGADRSHVTSGFDEITDANPSGQQFTLTEATTLVDGEALQIVILSDENGNVLDQKQGHTGDHVIIEMNGSSLEYVFLGPTETGDPILVSLLCLNACFY